MDDKGQIIRFADGIFDRRPALWRLLQFWLASASLMTFGSCSERERAEVVLHVSPTTTSAPSEIELHKLHPTLGFKSEGELARTLADLKGKPISHARKMFRGYLHWAESLEEGRPAPDFNGEYVDIYPVAAPRSGRLLLRVRSRVIVRADFHPTPRFQD